MRVLSNCGIIILVVFCLGCVQPPAESASEKTLSSAFDTTIIVYDVAGKPLHYRQYVQLIETGKYSFKMNNGNRVIEKIPNEILKYVKTDSIILNSLIHRWMVMADNIIVEKAKRMLYLERNGKIIFEIPVQLGNSPVGAKQKEGDGRTPEGRYCIDYNVNRDAAYYRGFHISYPNEKDQANARRLGFKPGGDIMIHGTGPTRINLKDWTNGCIAISNSHIDTLTKYTTTGISIEIKK